jgi:hypothetical protein
MKKIFITVLAFGFISGCSVFGSIGGSAGSSANSSGGSLGNSSGNSSGGIFAKKTKEQAPLEQRIQADDTRSLIAVVNDVTVDKFRGGVLIKARGTADSMGYSEVNLVAVNGGLPDENGGVTYEFKGDVPLTKFKGPTTRSNEVYAGASIPAIRLPSVKSIKVVAAQNQIIVSK